MIKKMSLPVMGILFLIVAAIFIEDGWIYSVATTMAVMIIVTIRSLQSTGIKITRWAKANPRKTQVLIGILQMLIVCASLFIGYDLKQLGYEVNQATTIIFGFLLVCAFFSIPFFPKQNTIALPAVVNRDRFLYMTIILSAFVILLVTGNRIEDRFPNSPISVALRSVDHSLFGNELLTEGDYITTDQKSEPLRLSKNISLLAFTSITGVEEKSNTNEILPKKEVKEAKAGKKAERLDKNKKKLMKRIEKLRKLVGAGTTVGTVLLIILLIFTSCAGVCLMAIGGSAGAVLLGVVLFAGSVFGFIKIFQKKQRTKAL